MMKNKPKSRILDEIQKSALDLAEVGIITKERMSEYEILYNTNATINTVSESKNKKLAKKNAIQ